MAAFGFRPVKDTLVDDIDVFADEYVMYIYLKGVVPDSNLFIQYYYQKKDIVLFENKKYEIEKIMKDYLVVLKTAKQRILKGMYDDIYQHDLGRDIIRKIQNEMDLLEKKISC